jgi:TrmH family RNA methyltransferase
MLTNSQIRFVKSLQQRKFREEHAVFVVEGVKILKELLTSDWQIDTLYFTDDFDDTLVTANVAERYRVSGKDLSRISGLKNPNQVLAVVKQRRVQLDPKSIQSELCLALDDVGDPGNLGTIIRLADWFGIKTIVCSARCVELYNPKVVQSTMGSMFRVAVYQNDLSTFLARAKKEASLPVLGAVLEGTSIYDMKLPSAGVLVMGSESHGISETNLAELTDRITIPSYGAAESLNVSTATAVMLAEFKRQGA